MGNTYKDRSSKYDLPRVPNWARPKPTEPHEDDRKKRKQNKERKERYDNDEY